MKVSVFLITYNHERYIEQAVRSALAQETTFDFEIIIGEDASTDATGRIVRQLEQAHPRLVRATVRDRNVGICRNFIETYRACRGDYVAFLDGDDYWTSPHKLQKQVDLLDGQPDLSLCFHDALTVDGDGVEQPLEKIIPDRDGPVRTRFELEELLYENFIPSCTILARNRLIDSFPEWVSRVRFLDWVFSVLNARRGGIGYIPEAMAVYRQHPGGVWSTLPWERRQDQFLEFYAQMKTCLPPSTHPLLRAMADKVRLQSSNVWLASHLKNYQTELQRLVAEVQALRSAHHELTLLVEKYQPRSAHLHACYQHFERWVGVPAIRALRCLRRPRGARAPRRAA